MDSVIADESTVRLAGSQRLEAGTTVRASNQLAFGIEILDEGLDIRVSLIDGKSKAAVTGKVMMLRGAHDRVHFRLHHRIGQPYAQLISVIGTEVDREGAVDLALFQSFQRRLRRRIGHRLEADVRIFQAACGMGKIIAERAGQFPRLRVLRAEGQIIIPIPDADWAMLRKPFLLGRRQESVRFREIKIFFRHSLIEILEKIAPQINSDKVVNPEAFLKIIKPLCISVENTLPMLMECQDNLEYLKDDNSFVLRQKIAHIEDDLLPPIIEYIRAHDKKD